MAQQTSMQITSQYQGNLVATLNQLPYSTTYLTDGFTQYNFNARSTRRPMAVGAQFVFNGTFPSFPLTRIYANAPAQTSQDTINYTLTGAPQQSLGSFSVNMLRSLDNRLWGYGDSGNSHVAYWCMFGDRGIVQTTKPNVNSWNVLSGTFGQGDIGQVCNPANIGFLNPPVTIYSRNVFGSSFVFSPFNETLYPDGTVRNKWGFTNNGCTCPYNIQSQISPTPTAYNHDGIRDYALFNSPAVNHNFLVIENNAPGGTVGYYDVTLDDPNLAARFATQLVTAQPFSSGWIFVLDVDGYNPKTGYHWIVIVMNFDMTKYWTVQFAPGNAQVNTCLAFNVHGGVPWSVYLDQDGFFYVSNNKQDASANGGQTLMSGHINFAWNLNVPPSTFALPCFDPCFFGDT